MPTSDDLAPVTVTELATRIRQREVSPVDTVEAAIERIEAANDRLNAFVHLGFDDARERARKAERALTAGGELGPLHGVPTAMNDLFDFKPGWPTSFGGVRALKDFMPDFSCAWAERIERAGAILVGETNSPVMGFRGTCDNPFFGPSRNPSTSRGAPAAPRAAARPSPGHRPRPARRDGEGQDALEDPAAARGARQPLRPRPRGHGSRNGSAQVVVDLAAPRRNAGNRLELIGHVA
jgi:amidase